ncbi:DUF1858 domain-containing protein [Marinicauda pacifica]|uniref:DUF1858 domain-containing protein n=1 Tax=Marinicauda pacifica TaxID=1133559 RepID=UPI0035C81901
MPRQVETLIVADVMNRWPQTVPVFVRHRMACPGCIMAPFMTVTEAALEYGLKPDALAADLADAMALAQAGPASV